jgi:spore coat polysaccharide biosynthesis protein SpsF (cytidylyltransferase family)
MNRPVSILSSLPTQVWLLCLALLAPLVFPAAAQSRRETAPPLYRSDHWSPQFPQQGRQHQDEEALQAERERARKANEQRQLELKRDTENLLQLATELKQDVDKTNENILSLEVIRKAEQIEKLAKNVKQKMKSTY